MTKREFRKFAKKHARNETERDLLLNITHKDTSGRILALPGQTPFNLNAFKGKRLNPHAIIDLVITGNKI